MGNFQRKAVLATAAAITTGAAVFMSMGSAHAATAASAVPAARAVLANHAVQAAPELTAALAWPTVKQGAVGERVFAIQYLLQRAWRSPRDRRALRAGDGCGGQVVPVEVAPPG